ncbi:pancreatic triacylglycerol lipase-like [Mya arenaria]|uniref:pancreatic triacylglycerol lipase-like n=1 Tax=Mya arenaria TaxID=6604 RepID=UPI0022E493CF|nr:pancreatic triacylglycerol lipase-like [Mya arenaria]
MRTMLEQIGIRLWFCVFLATSVWAAPGAERQKRSRTCFGELGCFANLPPFNNTDGLLPQSPDTIQTTFRLFTTTCKRPRVLTQGDASPYTDCGFDPTLPVKFIVHGFLQHGQVAWVRDMTNALLRKEPMSVVTVDWGSGSGFPYSQAAANTRVVGTELGTLISTLRSERGVRADKIHIIGHSLGAHIAGYAGNVSPGIARITGLDPAEPDFSDTDLAVHLDKTDALFVDIIHSDGAEFDYVTGFGWIAAVGHIDFYPNGGMNQPGCPQESVSNIMSAAYNHGIEDAEDTLSCSHSRSIYLFTESILSTCPFFGHPCSSLEALDKNAESCLRCPRGNCPQMGYDADKTGLSGKFYLRTRGSAPFCGESQHVTVEFGSMDTTSGQVRVELVGEDLSSDAVHINSNNDPFKSGDRRHVLVVDRERVSDVTQVRVTYARPSSQSWWWWHGSVTTYSVSIFSVTVTNAEDGLSVHFCGDYRTVTNGNTITLSRGTTDPNACLVPQSNVHRADPLVARHQIV